VTTLGSIPPDEDADSAWWWDSLRRGALMLPRCQDCKTHFFPPMPGCPHCGSTELGAEPASGRGTIYSWVVVHRALDPVFADDVPYTILTVDLDEGPRVFGRADEQVVPAAGVPVRFTPYRVGDEVLMGFSPEP
jgi:hypothetical protein